MATQPGRVRTIPEGYHTVTPHLVVRGAGWRPSVAFVPEVPYEKADSTLRDSYDKILEVFGFLPHFWQAQGTQPETLRASLGLWAQIYRSGVLPSGAHLERERAERNRLVTA